MYNSYPSDYTTYEAVNDQLKPLTNNADLTGDKSTIIGYIHDASTTIREWCHRTFVPYIDSSAQALYSVSPYRVQELPDDCLVLNSIQDTAGTTLTASTYRTRDIHNQLSGYPYRYFELAYSADYETNDTNNFSPAWTLDGIWGYHTQPYANAWANTTTLNQGEQLSASATSVTVTSAAAIETLDYIRIDTELMQVTAISTNTLTVTRGVNGSTAATHEDGTQVDVWQVIEPVALACTKLAGWLYQSRQNELQSVQFQDGTVATATFPQMVRTALRPYIKPYFNSV